MRDMGVDLGSRRIGLAISDRDRVFAFPLAAIASAGRARDVKVLGELIAQQEVGRVVVGLPLHMSGRLGVDALAAKEFAAALARATGLPVDMQDERLTTVEAERALTATLGRKQREKSRKSGKRDSIAATIILRTWLERTGSGSAAAEPREPTNGDGSR